jgi:hypothetical protein
VTRVGRWETKDGQRISLTVLLLPQVTGDQEWEEEIEKIGSGPLTVVLLAQVTGDQEWEEEGEDVQGLPNCSSPATSHW